MREQETPSRRIRAPAAIDSFRGVSVTNAILRNGRETPSIGGWRHTQSNRSKRRSQHDTGETNTHGQAVEVARRCRTCQKRETGRRTHLRI